MAAHNELGKKGEEYAQKYLWANGYEILETNYCFEKAEIDIIALKEGIISVIEVKTRSTDYFGNPEESVTYKKEQLLSDAIDQYLIEKNIDLPIQFDIISIIMKVNQAPSLNHIKEAFRA